MKKRCLILGVVIISLVIVGVLFFMGFGKKGSVDNTVITSLKLESFPAGTQLGPNMRGTETTTIILGQVVSLDGEVTTDGIVDSSLKIFDEANNAILEQECVRIKGTGGFGCSIDYPRTAGRYVLKFYINGEEKTSFGFEVRE